jgi:2-dehydro-3-deoxygluconokinase
MSASYDLVSLGEVMLRLSPPRYERLRRTLSLDVRVSGSQLNVAANLARLGKRSAFVSKLPANELGLLARDACLSYGVDVSHLKLEPGARMGVNYVEFSATPRGSIAVYDRAGSAASAIQPGDFDWSVILSGARLAYTDGIFPGLSASCRETAREFIRSAREQGCRVCFDVNYREHLWTPAAARTAWEALLPDIDIVATNRSVSEEVFGYKGSDEDLMHRYQDEFGCTVVCLTHREIAGVLRGAWSSQAIEAGQLVQGSRFDFDVIDRFGTGDAWFAGVLFGILEGETLERSLNFGNALCALAHTIEGDIAHVSPEEVWALVDRGYDFRLRR